MRQALSTHALVGGFPGRVSEEAGKVIGTETSLLRQYLQVRSWLEWSRM